MPSEQLVRPVIIERSWELDQAGSAMILPFWPFLGRSVPYFAAGLPYTPKLPLFAISSSSSIRSRLSASCARAANVQPNARLAVDIRGQWRNVELP